MANGLLKLELKLYNDAAEIPRAHDALDQFAAAHGLAGPELARLHVALEEHLTNVISYGYDPGQPGVISLRFTFQPSWLGIEIEDDARTFNSSEAKEVDITLSLDAKPVGGLGLLLLRKCVDELNYHRENEHNVLVLKKRVSVPRSE